jgi:S1-C subfamily serine protease
LKLTDGLISALSGIGGDVRTYQLSVPVQGGNSGGPVLNMQGEVVAVVVAKLDAAKMFQWTGDLPENVSYGIKVAYLNPLMESVRPLRSPSQMPSSSADLAALTARVRGSVALVIAE